MSDQKDKHIKDRIPEITKYLLVLGLIVFISFLFPNNARFKYEFDKGQTWRYNDLTAPFDFAIIKPDEEIDTEKQEISAGFSPYYELDPSIASQRKQTFALAFREQLELESAESQFQDIFQQTNNYLNFGYQFIDRIYNLGVIGSDVQLEGKEDNFVINIIKRPFTNHAWIRTVKGIEFWNYRLMKLDEADRMEVLPMFREDARKLDLLLGSTYSDEWGLNSNPSDTLVN